MLIISFVPYCVYTSSIIEKAFPCLILSASSFKYCFVCTDQPPFLPLINSSWLFSRAFSIRSLPQSHYLLGDTIEPSGGRYIKYQILSFPHTISCFQRMSSIRTTDSEIVIFQFIIPLNRFFSKRYINVFKVLLIFCVHQYVFVQQYQILFLSTTTGTFLPYNCVYEVVSSKNFITEFSDIVNFSIINTNKNNPIILEQVSG